jgi:hypothetical protein
MSVSGDSGPIPDARLQFKLTATAEVAIFRRCNTIVQWVRYKTLD